jgi:hypothetical protein
MARTTLTLPPLDAGVCEEDFECSAMRAIELAAGPLPHRVSHQAAMILLDSVRQLRGRRAMVSETHRVSVRLPDGRCIVAALKIAASTEQAHGHAPLTEAEADADTHPAAWLQPTEPTEDRDMGNPESDCPDAERSGSDAGSDAGSVTESD